MAQLHHLLRMIWHNLREACGENDYERYRARACTPGVEAMTPEAFYLARLHQKYLRPNRCC